MAGNLALAESSPEIGFLLKQTANHAAGIKLFIWLPVEESRKNTIWSATVSEVSLVCTEKRIFLPQLDVEAIF